MHALQVLCQVSTLVTVLGLQHSFLSKFSGGHYIGQIEGPPQESSELISTALTDESRYYNNELICM